MRSACARSSGNVSLVSPSMIAGSASYRRATSASIAGIVGHGSRSSTLRMLGSARRFAVPELDLVIRNGMVVDGAMSPRYVADIAVRDGVIVEIGRVRGRGARELDATGLVVAPGFVDLHTHYDAQVFWDPYCSLSGWHGVTSVAIGNCGFGFAPVRAAERERAMMSMTRVEAIPMASMKEGMPWSWVTFPEFLDAVDKAPKAVNILPYVPISPLLIWVMG